MDRISEQHAQPLHDGQAETKAFLAGAARISDLEEFLEYSFLIVLLDADAGVANFDVHCLAGGRGGNRDFSRRRIAYGVADQVAQYAL